MILDQVGLHAERCFQVLRLGQLPCKAQEGVPIRAGQRCELRDILGMGRACIETGDKGCVVQHLIKMTDNRVTFGCGGVVNISQGCDFRLIKIFHRIPQGRGLL